VDKARAVELFVKACDASLDEACKTLGTLYEEGKDVPADKAASLRYYGRACDLGDPSGCAKVGKAP